MAYMKLNHPFTMMVSGPTSCGKTRWCFELLKNLNEMCPEIEQCIYCYGIDQKIFSEMKCALPLLEFIEGFSSEVIEKLSSEKPTLLVLDDMMNQLCKNSELCNLFTRGSHHLNCSIVFLVQNLFHQDKFSRTISLNTHYFSIFRQLRDRNQISTLARQMFPQESKYFLDAFKQATEEERYGYLFVDVHPSATIDECRLRTKIFPSDAFHFGFVKK